MELDELSPFRRYDGSSPPLRRRSPARPLKKGYIPVHDSGTTSSTLDLDDYEYDDDDAFDDASTAFNTPVLSRYAYGATLEEGRGGGGSGTKYAWSSSSTKYGGKAHGARFSPYVGKGKGKGGAAKRGGWWCLRTRARRRAAGCCAAAAALGAAAVLLLMYVVGPAMIQALIDEASFEILHVDLAKRDPAGDALDATIARRDFWREHCCRLESTRAAQPMDWTFIPRVAFAIPRGQVDYGLDMLRMKSNKFFCYGADTIAIRKLWWTLKFVEKQLRDDPKALERPVVGHGPSMQ